MGDERGTVPPPAIDIGEYCRRVEAHLGQVNAGELIRIVGTGFELVRDWARAGIPLSVVFYGIDRKAERHRAGAARRSLRIEFCAADVLEAFAQWKRAVGSPLSCGVEASGAGEAGTSAGAPREGVAGEGAAGENSGHRRRPSLSKHLERVIDRLVRAAGRLESPEDVRAVLSDLVADVAGLQEGLRARRGRHPEPVAERLAELDRFLIERVRQAVPEVVPSIQREAEAELAAYRGRMRPDAWAAAVTASVERLIRDRYGLPILDPDKI